jgi:ankyrin repeat protein
LSLTAKRGNEAVVKLLLETGKVNVDCMDTDGRTPLWWAAHGLYEGHKAVFKLLQLHM